VERCHVGTQLAMIVKLTMILATSRQGWHLHLRKALDSWAIAPDVADAVMLELAFQWNVKMEHNHMGHPPWGFTSLDMLDRLKVSGP
jgi:hypothetical protein